MPKKARKPREPGAITKPSEKPLSLYPLTLEEAVDRLLKVRPEVSRSGKAKPSGPSADANASRTRQE
jgi:hypothetical protein